MGAKVRIIIDIVSLNGKKKVSLAVVVCIISVIQIQKDLWLFRAAPFAFVVVGTVIESTLSDIRRHPHPRLPVGRLKSRKYKKSAFGGKKKSGSRRYKNSCFRVGSLPFSPCCAALSGRQHWQAIAYLLLSFGKDSKRLFFYRRSRTFFTAVGRFLLRGVF